MTVSLKLMIHYGLYVCVLCQLSVFKCCGLLNSLLNSTIIVNVNYFYNFLIVVVHKKHNYVYKTRPASCNLSLFIRPNML